MNKPFHIQLTEAMAALGMSDKELAHRFDMSLPTAARWKDGRAKPHPIMQKHALAILNQLIKEKLYIP